MIHTVPPEISKSLPSNQKSSNSSQKHNNLNTFKSPRQKSPHHRQSYTEIRRIKYCLRGRLTLASLMAMERFCFKMAMCLKAPSKMVSHSMEFSYLMRVVTLWVASKTTRRLEWAFTKTYKMDITMRGNGRKTCRMGKEQKNIQILIITKEPSCLGVSLGRECIHFQMGRSMRALFIMGTPTGMER